MPTMKAIKRRRVSVTETQQIMKAMNLVATSKLQKAKKRLSSVRPLFDEMRQVIANAVCCDGAEDSVFVRPREVKNTAYVVVTSDRGLCGSYNLNISKEAYLHMDGKKKEKMICVGSKGRDYFRRRGKAIKERYIGVSEAALYKDAQELGAKILELYLSGEVDEVYAAYTHFETVLSHKPTIVKILPLNKDLGEAKKKNTVTYEPTIEKFLEEMTPMFLDVFVYGAMVESAACEQAARMTSMDAAKKNAEDIINDLTLMYNRKRQGIITQEITEIVSGANALQ